MESCCREGGGKGEGDAGRSAATQRKSSSLLRRSGGNHGGAVRALKLGSMMIRLARAVSVGHQAAESQAGAMTVKDTEGARARREMEEARKRRGGNNHTCSPANSISQFRLNASTFHASGAAHAATNRAATAVKGDAKRSTVGAPNLFMMRWTMAGRSWKSSRCSGRRLGVSAGFAAVGIQRGIKVVCCSWHVSHKVRRRGCR